MRMFSLVAACLVSVAACGGSDPIPTTLGVGDRQIVVEQPLVNWVAGNVITGGDSCQLFVVSGVLTSTPGPFPAVVQPVSVMVFRDGMKVWSGEPGVGSTQQRPTTGSQIGVVATSCAPADAQEGMLVTVVYELTISPNGSSVFVASPVTPVRRSV